MAIIPKVACFHPFTAFVWVSAFCPVPEHLPLGMFHFSEDIFGCRVSVVIRPSPYRPTVCPSVASRNLLLYQSLPISILYRYALGRRRKDDTGVGTASKGIVE